MPVYFSTIWSWGHIDVFRIVISVCFLLWQVLFWISCLLPWKAKKKYLWLLPPFYNLYCMLGCFMVVVENLLCCRKGGILHCSDTVHIYIYIHIRIYIRIPILIHIYTHTFRSWEGRVNVFGRWQYQSLREKSLSEHVFNTEIQVFASPHVTPLDFCFWGCVKGKADKREANTRDEWLAGI
jgi:hypothetical protein